MIASTLREWEEARGPLYEIKELDDVLVARIGPVEVVLPMELKERLETQLGGRVGILRTEKDYRVRCLEA